MRLLCCPNFRNLHGVLTTLLLSASDSYLRDNIQQTGYYLRDTDESLDSSSTYSFASSDSSQSTLDGNQAQIPFGHAGSYYHPSSNGPAQPNYLRPLRPQLLNMNHYGRFSTSSLPSSPALSEASSRSRSHGYFPEYPRSV